MNPALSEKQELWSYKGTWPWASLYLAFRDSLRNICRCLMFLKPSHRKPTSVEKFNKYTSLQQQAIALGAILLAPFSRCSRGYTAG